MIASAVGSHHGREAAGLSAASVRILLWHGYLLEGTGSNVYTRAIAREWSAQGTRSSSSARSRIPSASTSAGPKSSAPSSRTACCPVFVLDRYEGLEARLLQDLTTIQRARYVDANARALEAHLPADLVFANHVLPGGAVAAATGARYAVKAHGSELEYSIRGNEELAAEAREALAGRRRRVRRLRPHPRRARGGRRPRRPTSTRCRPASTSTSSARGRAPRRSRRCSPRRAATRPNPGNRERAPPGRGQRPPARALLRGRAADRRLLREAPLQQGRPPADRGAARDRRARRDRRLRRLPRSSSRSWRRGTRSSPGRSSTGISSTCSRSRTSSSCRRSSRRRSGWSPPRPRRPACRRSSRAIPGWPRSPPGSRRRIRERHRALASFTSGDPIDLAEKLHELLQLRRRERAGLGAAARRVAVERWSWESVAERLARALHDVAFHFNG